MKTNLKYAADRMMPIGAKDMVKAYVDEEFAKRQKIYTRRILLAACIAILVAKEVETADVIPVVRCAEEAERVTIWQAAAEFGRSASDTWENANSATKTLADALYKPEEEE